MAPKITPKNLSYDTTLPPFLARMRGQAGGAYSDSHDGPDSMLAARRRPAAPRRLDLGGEDGDDDAPLVVDEGGNVVGGVSVARDGTVREEEEEEEEEGGGGDGDGPGVTGGGGGDGGREGEGGGEGGAGRAKDAEKIAAIGGGKKRKAGRVVGGDADADADADGDGGLGRAKGQKKGDKGSGGGKTAAVPKIKKKAKKIKLSFGDDEG